MNFTFLKKSSKPKTIGGLRIDAPHWAVEVHILNSMFENVLLSGMIRRDAQSRTGYLLETDLAPGVYEVRLTLEGKTVSHWVPINEGEITVLTPEAWKDLSFTSASPITEIENFNEIHTAKAKEFSRTKTFVVEEKANSRLFLFVRTLNPQSGKHSFYDGLALLDCSGEIVTDFSSGVRSDMKEGWMAFNADLPSGGYILRRGRRGVRLRYQTIYLCPRWETQIFLNAARYPSLRTWSFNMALKGMGFQPDSVTGLANEVITDALRHSTESLLLFQNEGVEKSLEILLDEKLGNPWLGVLAAHAILNLESQADVLRNQLQTKDSTQKRRIEDEIEKSEEYSAIWRDKVRPFLQNTIGEHPDVRALTLDDEHATDQPFNFPPSLIAGLQKIQSHALKYYNTIPPNSLTDRINENLVPNSPWTAWRRLTAKKRNGAAANTKTLRTVKTPNPDFSVSSVLSQTVVARTPVYRLADLEKSNIQKPSSETVLQDAPMIQKSKEVVLAYAQSSEMESIPSEVSINSAADINNALSQVSPDQVSQSFGISLARTEESLSALQEQASQLQAGTETVSASNPPLASVQQAVLEFALNAPERSGTENDQPIRKFLVREIVEKIQSEADRLLTVSASNESLRVGDAIGLAKRLYKIANELLRHADFVVLTDSHGKVQYCNGTFLLLISPRSEDRVSLKGEGVDKVRLKNQRTWEKVLKKTPKGISFLLHPQLEDEWQSWKLSRTEIKDDASHRSSHYLNVLRVRDVSTLDDSQLEEINNVTAKFSLFVPLWLYGSSEHQSEYIEQVEATTNQLETSSYGEKK